MHQVAKEGRTVAFVSHNLAIIQTLCRRAVLLERGRVIADGPVKETIDGYMRKLESEGSDDLLKRTDRDTRAYDETLVRQIEVREAEGANPGVVVGGRRAVIVVHVTEVLPAMECRLTVLDSLGSPVMTMDSEISAERDERNGSLGKRIECELEALTLVPGRYRVDVLLKANNHIQDGLQAAAFFEVQPGVIGDRPVPTSGWEGDVIMPHTWRLPA
jgi:lipopolysaccharide transport system ATP-binding protein